MNKFLGIQLDGLSHEKLMEAAKHGYCPFLKHLMRKEYTAYKYSCGLPSNTPFAQAGILYGHNKQIPGFTFIDKELRKELTIRNPFHTYIMEHLYLEHHKGILKNGTSIVNLFSGGANYSRLTSSQTSKHILRQFDILLFFLKPKVTARVLYHSAQNISTGLDYLYEKFFSLFHKYAQASDFKYNITRLFSCVVFEELETNAVIGSMKKGVPHIYVTYNGYDENSHHQGPSSPVAFHAIKSIDKKIKRLFEHSKEYDIYILSDHGHTQAVPFKKLYNTSFPAFMHNTLKPYKHKTMPHHMARMHQKSKGTKKTILSPLARMEKTFHSFMANSLKNHNKEWHWNSHPYFLSVSDDLANLYFNSSINQLSLDRINTDYPGLIEKLVKHPGIGIIAARQEENTHIINKHGEAIVGKNLKFKGERFLQHWGDEERLCRQFQYLVNMKNSGDLIIMGDYSKNNVISFINHFGSHGSAGGEQMQPFFMSAKKHDFSKTINVKDLYDVFIKYHK